ncbi:MAG TPA: recombinase family protein [Patescibacteria group bacterium]|nr:recombinase family protein [Patescibacteria group bacterium]
MPSINSIQNDENVLYCLYARKSSEDDERQAMSIDSQVKEMTDLAQKEGLIIKEVRRESHSAKESGQRAVFKQLLSEIREGVFTGILTWAPDRLSRNAGDLGQLVDLMDQGKLTHIKTFTQAFSDTPSDKFLLMILCSQAKLENDQKGVNVKRGIRAKCEMGWRPGMSPIGYYNRAMNGIKDIVVDPDRGHIITEMFERVARNGDSGRTIKKWLDTCLTTRSGKKVTLSLVYQMLKNPFYYGEFQYPIGIGGWYKGSHQPLTTKEIFDQVQKQHIIPFKKAKWGSKVFTFKGLFKCASCGASIVAEDKYRKRKARPSVYHIYYHCSRKKDYDCPEPFVNEEKLIKELLRYINFTNMAHPQTIKQTPALNCYLDEYRKVREMILLQQDIDPNHQPLDLYEYAKYALRNGSMDEKKVLINSLGENLYIHDRFVSSSPVKSQLRMADDVYGTISP